MKVNHLGDIIDGKYTLIVRKNNRVIFRSNQPGIKGLIMASQNNFLQDATIYDKTVGLAAAKIAVFSGARKIYTLLASRLALVFCQDKKVSLKSEEIVERIYDSENRKECELEKIAQKINNLPELIKHFILISGEYEA